MLRHSSYVHENVKEEDVILTNCSHLNWTILSYYFPNINHDLISFGFDKFESDKSYWLFWETDLLDKDLEWLDSCGYSIEPAYLDGILGCNKISIYKLIKNYI